MLDFIHKSLSKDVRHVEKARITKCKYLAHSETRTNYRLLDWSSNQLPHENAVIVHLKIITDSVVLWRIQKFD